MKYFLTPTVKFRINPCRAQLPLKILVLESLWQLRYFVMDQVKLAKGLTFAVSGWG